jgi:hypothetical protein
VIIIVLVTVAVVAVLAAVLTFERVSMEAVLILAPMEATAAEAAVFIFRSLIMSIP